MPCGIMPCIQLDKQTAQPCKWLTRSSCTMRRPAGSRVCFSFTSSMPHRCRCLALVSQQGGGLSVFTLSCCSTANGFHLGAAWAMSTCHNCAFCCPGRERSLPPPLCCCCCACDAPCTSGLPIRQGRCRPQTDGYLLPCISRAHGPRFGMDSRMPRGPRRLGAWGEEGLGASSIRPLGPCLLHRVWCSSWSDSGGRAPCKRPVEECLLRIATRPCPGGLPGHGAPLFALPDCVKPSLECVRRTRCALSRLSARAVADQPGRTSPTSCGEALKSVRGPVARYQLPEARPKPIAAGLALLPLQTACPGALKRAYKS